MINYIVVFSVTCFWCQGLYNIVYVCTKSVQNCIENVIVIPTEEGNDRLSLDAYVYVSQLTIVQFLKSEADATVRSKIVSCFTRYL